jgi:hypothetical protein
MAIANDSGRRPAGTRLGVEKHVYLGEVDAAKISRFSRFLAQVEGSPPIGRWSPLCAHRVGRAVSLGLAGRLGRSERGVEHVRRSCTPPSIASQ